jgi:Zn-dependent protease with chaperone function
LTVVADIAILALGGGFCAVLLGAFLTRRAAGRLIPELRSIQVAGGRRYPAFIGIILTIGLVYGLSEIRTDGIVLPTSVVLLLLLLYIMGYHAGSWRWRCQILEETWTRSEMLVFQVRWFLIFLGPQVALVIVPDLCAEAGSAWFGLPVGILLTGWWWQGSRVIPAVMRAREMEDGPLRTRLDQLAARSEVDSVRWLCCGPERGSFANAFALPEPAWQTGSGHAVLIGQQRLNACSDDEVEAICAHEIAHLEDYDPAKTRRIVLQFILPVVFGCGVFPYIATINDSGRWFGFFGWLMMWIILFRWIARRRLAEEDASDHRVIELGSSAEALIGALEKLYARTAIPRRVQAAAETAATHPSLARRVGLIRRGAGLPPPPVHAFCTPGLKGGHVAVTEDGVQLHQPAPTKTKPPPLPIEIGWAELGTLLISPRKTDAALSVLSVDGEKKGVLFLTHQAAAELESLLASVDTRMAPLSALMRVAAVGRRRGLRWMLGVVLFLMIVPVTEVPGLGWVVVPAVLICMVRVTRAWILATGVGLAMLGISAIRMGVHGPLADTESIVGFGALLLPFAMSLILSAFETRRDFVAGFRRGRVLIAVLSLLLLAGVAAATTSVHVLLVAAPVCLAPLIVRRRRKV